MAYTKEDLFYLGVTDLQSARKKIVDISLFDNIDNIKLSDKTKKDIEFTKEIYIDYLKDLEEFKETDREKILKALMNTETIDNHSLEREDINLLRDYYENHHSTAIRYLIKKLMNENQPLNENIIKKAHEILMRGTSNESIVCSGYRDNNKYFVGYVEDGQKIINFLPICHEEIKEAMQAFINYYESTITEEFDLLAKPFIIHGLLATMQVFEDGNTRLARTLQHIKLQTLTNELFTHEYNLSPFNLPAIYFSKNYIPFRYEYRKLIEDLALIHDDDEWNKWIEFNLYRMQERIFATDNSLILLKRKK